MNDLNYYVDALYNVEWWKIIGVVLMIGWILDVIRNSLFGRTKKDE